MSSSLSFAKAKVIFGTSSLGNLFVELDKSTKKALMKAAIENSPAMPIFDSAGKYGAGLALESLAQALKQLNISPDEVKISNKLGWKRIALTAPEPTFEPDVWKNLKHDAVQTISYQGILDCYHQGNELLGDYQSRIVSVHDPDEYIANATDKNDLAKRKQDILDAYQALIELKTAGKVESIGVGAKDVSIINFISNHIPLDWAMFACSLTPYAHKNSTLTLLKKLGKQGVEIINSAVFNAGFLLGSDNLNYQKISPASHPNAYQWREQFYQLCKQFNVKPAAVCVQFSFLFPEVVSIALNSSSPERVKSNILLAQAHIPEAFWQAMYEHRLINITPTNR